MGKKMGNKTGNKMGIVLSWEFCTNEGIWVLGQVGFLDFLDILLCESKGITWEWEILGAEPPQVPRSRFQGLLAGNREFELFLIKTRNCFGQKGPLGSSHSLPLPFNILGIPNIPWNDHGWFFGQSQSSKAGRFFQLRFRAGSDPSSMELFRTAFSLCCVGEKLNCGFFLSFPRGVGHVFILWGISSKLDTHTLKIPLFSHPEVEIPLENQLDQLRARGQADTWSLCSSRDFFFSCKLGISGERASRDSFPGKGVGMQSV